MKNEQLFTPENILRSRDYKAKGFTQLNKGRVKESQSQELESMASLGSFDNQSYNMALYAEEMGIPHDTDVDGIYQGYDDDTDVESHYQGYDDDTAGYWN